MKLFRRMKAALLIAALTVGLAVPSQTAEAGQSRTGYFSRNYSMEGSQQDQIVSIARAQLEKKKATLHYTEAWCADFVSDCAKLAGLSDIIPANGLAAGLYNSVLNAGGTRVSSPCKGDLVFYYCSSCGRIVHTGIMVSSEASVEGNFSRKVSYVPKYYYVDSYGHSVRSGRISRRYVRPAYKEVMQWNEDSAVMQTGTSTEELHVALTFGTMETLSAEKDSTEEAGAQNDFTDEVKGYFSSRTSVAAVDADGKITAKGIGTTYITAKLKSGRTASIKIKVQKSEVETQALEVTNSDVTVKVGRKCRINTITYPLTASQKIEFTSGNKKIAEVDGKGQLTGKKKGQTTVTIERGQRSATVNVQVN